MKKLAATFALASFALFGSACDQRLLEAAGSGRIAQPHPSNPPTCPPDYSPGKPSANTLSCSPPPSPWR